MTLKPLYLLAFLWVCISTCDTEKDHTKTGSLIIISIISPGTGVPGTEVTIIGEGFATATENNKVKFNGITAMLLSTSETELIALAPEDAETGKITVEVNSEIAMGPVFTYLEDTGSEGVVMHNQD